VRQLVIKVVNIIDARCKHEVCMHNKNLVNKMLKI